MAEDNKKAEDFGRADVLGFLTGIKSDGTSEDSLKRGPGPNDDMKFLETILKRAVEEAQRHDTKVFDLEDPSDLKYYSKIRNLKRFHIDKESDFQATKEEFSPDGSGNKETSYKRVVDYTFLVKRVFVEVLVRAINSELGTDSFYEKALAKYFPDTKDATIQLYRDLRDGKDVDTPEDTSDGNDPIDDLPEIED